jgi:hypothetical protein
MASKVRTPSSTPNKKPKSAGNGGENSGIQVAIRVRPLNATERGRGDGIIVETKGSSVTLRDPITAAPDTKNYHFVFGSSDSPEDSQYNVFQQIGIPLVDNVFKGYNCCILAYGMTGSGKTYSMLGSSENPGLIPRICEELFRRATVVGAMDGEDITLNRCQVSFLEVYGSKIHDLLNLGDNLEIRTSTSAGTYVEGLTNVAVRNAGEIMNILDRGSKSRAVAETKMNHMSSRSHAIFTINWKQIIKKKTKTIEKTSKIHLVDLAGSERIDLSGVVGQQLKEAIAINSSLSALARVIDELIKRSTHIPFRDNPLTWLLADSLGGNSKTVLVATVSPCSASYEQTKSTLRYADNARQVINKVKVNENSDEDIIASLRLEIDDLKRRLAAESNSETIEKLKQDLEQREKLFEEMSMSWEDKLAKSDKLIEEMKSREVELREQLASVDDSTAKLQNKIKLRDLEIAELKATLRIAKSSESSKVEALEAKIKLNERVFNETIETLKREHENAINKLSMDIISTARQEKEELEARYKDIVEKSKQEVSVSYEAKIGAIKLALEDKNAEIADLMKTMGEEVQLIGQQYSDQHVRGTTTLKSAFQKKVASIMEEIEMNNQTHKETMERMMTRHEQQLKEKEEAHDKFVKEKEEKYHASLQEIQTSYDKLIKEKETSMHELQVTHDKLVKEKKIAEMRMSAFGISIKDLGNKVSRSASAASMTPEQK